MWAGPQTARFVEERVKSASIVDLFVILMFDIDDFSSAGKTDLYLHLFCILLVTVNTVSDQCRRKNDLNCKLLSISD